MSKIAGWNKRIDSRLESEWVNVRTGTKVRIVGRANNFGGKNNLWDLFIFDNKGQYSNKSLNRVNMCKDDAQRFALKYMRSR